MNPFFKETLLKMNFVDKYIKLDKDHPKKDVPDNIRMKDVDSKPVLGLLKEYGLKPISHNKYYCLVSDKKPAKYGFYLSLDYKWGDVAAEWSIAYKGACTGIRLSLSISNITDNQRHAGEPYYSGIEELKEVIREEVELFFEFKNTFLEVVGDQEFMKIEPLNQLPMFDSPLAPKAIKEMNALEVYRSFTEPFPKRRMKREFTLEDIDRQGINEALDAINFRVNKITVDEYRVYFISDPYTEEDYTFYAVIDYWPFKNSSDMHVWIYKGEEVIFADSLHWITFKSVKHKDWLDFYYYDKKQIPEIAIKQAELFFLFKDAFMMVTKKK